ncbi:hypothetical protein BpHYR1_042376, partial [Brachionus plicatilis]
FLSSTHEETEPIESNQIDDQSNVCQLSRQANPAIYKTTSTDASELLSSTSYVFLIYYVSFQFYEQKLKFYEKIPKNGTFGNGPQ